ncbi:uncharacterized protein LOC112558523 [Pomacea canaliculata]|uniref:uncharacterized protein LOC112558523 n=1 Tax=Pomacea canaliculata TaxID=400727 RepID=UPI000D73C57F|nr:uncharacterized protein LOC112558523 [Pomacea canaliculata]
MDKKFCLTRREKFKELKEAGVERGLVGKDLWQYVDRELDKWWEEKKEEKDRVEREREREYAEREKERERRRAEREREYAEREKERERRRAEREKELEEREKELVMREFIEMLEEICEEKGKTEEESRKFIEYNLKGCRWGTIAEEREEKTRVEEEDRVARERARERVKSQKAGKEKEERTKREKEQEFLREVCRLGRVSLDDSDPAEAVTYRSERGVVAAVSCSRYGGAGHDPRSCPQQSERLRRSVGVKCYSCGVVGHYARSCPRGYELREAVTTRGEKLASEVDASNAYASDRSATDVQVSDVGPGDAVTSGAYTSGRNAADVKVNEVNPSKEEARGVETGEQASGKEGVFPGGGTTRERGGLGGVDFPNLLVSQAEHSHAVRQLQVQDQGLRKTRELVSGTRALQAAGSGDRERRVPVGRADLLQAGDTGKLEEQVPAVVKEPLQTGDGGSLGGQVPTVVRGPLQAVDNGHREMWEPTVFEVPLQTGDTGNLEEQVPAVREVLLQPEDCGSPKRLVPTGKSGTDWHRLVQTKDGADPGGQDPKVFEVPVQTGDTSDPEWGVLAVRCVPVIADGESGLGVKPAVSPAKRDGEVWVTIQTVVVKVSPTLAECVETPRSDRTFGAVQMKRHDEMQLEVQQLEEAIRRSNTTYEAAKRLEQAKQKELQDLLRAIADREREHKDARKALNRVRKKIRKEENKLNKLVSNTNTTLGRIRTDLVSKQELDKTSQTRLQRRKEASEMYANEKFGEVQNPIHKLEKKIGERNKGKNEVAKTLSALVEGAQRLHKDAAEVQALLREEQAWSGNTLTDIQQQWGPRKQHPHQNQERRRAQAEVAAKPRVVQQVSSPVNKSSSQLKLTYAMQKLEQNELENLRTQLAEETSDSERVRVGVKMHYQLKARVKSPTMHQTGGLHDLSRVSKPANQQGKGSRSVTGEGTLLTAGSDRTSRDVNKKGGAASVEIGETLFASGGQRERVQRDQKRVAVPLMRTPRVGPVWPTSTRCSCNEQ